MAVISKDLGAVTAYAAAANRGYTGTKEEFETLMASYATVAQQAAESAQSAGQSATDASQSAQNAETAKGTAQQAATDAQTAQASAQDYAQSAQQSAQSASQYAQSAESAKETAVDAVDGFAAGAQQALDDVNQAGINWKSLAQAKALDSEAWALGTRDGEDVGSSDPAYHNNAKYYAESISTSAQTASDAAQTATQKAGEAAQSASEAAESARTLTIDATLTQSGQAADSKVVGDKINNGYASITNIVNGSFLASGALNTKADRLRPASFIPVKIGDKIVIGSGSLKHACGAWDGTPSTGTNVRNDGSFSTADETIISEIDGFYIVVFAKQDSTQSISPADFDGYIHLYSGEIYKNSQRISQAEDEISSLQSDITNIPQNNLSFAELVMPENLFDYTSEDMCKPGWWYYGTSIGSTISAIQNANTTHYVAIKIPVYNSTKLTFGIYPNEISKLVYWIGAVDKDMRLIAYTTINQNAPITYNIPDGAVYVLLSYNLGSANFETYLPKVMAVNGDSITHYSSYFKPYYFLNDCKTNAEKPNEIAVMQSIIGTDENTVKLCLPDAYDLVVGDTFELFYKGIINAVNPDMYDILIDCSKGSAYSKRFIITPTTPENLTMTVTLFGINHNVLDTKSVTLRIHSKASSPATTKNVLCVGDSLTTAGQWPAELYRRLTASNGSPEGDGLTNINFIGTRVTASGVHYEGYGGFTLNTYNGGNVSYNARIITCTHDKTEAEDQHSVYKDTNNVQWKLETIEEGQIKIIAVTGEGRDFPNSGTLTWVSGGVNHADINYSAQEMAPGNPFWNSTAEEVDFATYASNLGVSGIDLVYVLIGWNSASWTESEYKESAQTFIDNVHTSYPNAKIVFVGLEIPARDGLGANYGATGIYSRYYDLMQFVFNLDQWYEDLVDNNTNVHHVNLAGQFDTEHNMLTATRQVNARNTETEVYQSNGVHPAYSGQMQIADAVYRDITARL